MEVSGGGVGIDIIWVIWKYVWLEIIYKPWLGDLEEWLVGKL